MGPGLGGRPPFVREEFGLRHRAALAHLALFPVLTWIWLPLVLRKADPDNEFLVQHTTGAAVYQGLAIVSLPIIWFGGMLPYWLMSQVTASMVFTFYAVVVCCAATLYVMGPIFLALQAWSGEPFWAPLVSYLLGYEPPPEV